MCDTVLVMTRTNESTGLSEVTVLIPTAMLESAQENAAAHPWEDVEFTDLGVEPGEDQQVAIMVGSQALLGFRLSRQLTNDNAWALLEQLEQIPADSDVEIDVIIKELV